jgi:hypothetical protein
VPLIVKFRDNPEMGNVISGLPIRQHTTTTARQKWPIAQVPASRGKLHFTVKNPSTIPFGTVFAILTADAVARPTARFPRQEIAIVVELPAEQRRVFLHFV